MPVRILGLTYDDIGCDNRNNNYNNKIQFFLFNVTLPFVSKSRICCLFQPEHKQKQIKGKKVLNFKTTAEEQRFFHKSRESQKR